VNKHRFAVIGCGGMESSHERAFLEMRDRVDVVATVDLELDRAKKAAEVLGAERAVSDYHEVLDDVDAVLVVLPHHLHHPVGIDCLRAGKHVMMEKPLAITEEECLGLIHTAREVDRVLMTAYVMRFHPLVVKLKQMIDDRELGDVFQISIWTEQLTRQGGWHNTAATLGGGQFFSHGCHYIDLLLWFLGSPVRGTHLGTRLGTEWMEKEGTSNVSLEFEGGALGYHFGTWGARGTKLRYSIHAHGTEGMAELELNAGILRMHKGDTIRTVQSDDRNSKKVAGELRHFLDSIDTGQPPLTDGPGSLQGLRVIWRLYEAETKNVVADLRGLALDAPWDRSGLGQLP
jgi:predicted dehydrogenase